MTWRLEHEKERKDKKMLLSEPSKPARHCWSFQWDGKFVSLLYKASGVKDFKKYWAFQWHGYVSWSNGMVAVFLVYKDLVNGRFGKRVSVYLLAYFHHPQSNQAFGGLFIAMVSCLLSSG